MKSHSQRFANKKALLLAAVPVLALGITGGVLALRPTPESKTQKQDSVELSAQTNKGTQQLVGASENNIEPVAQETVEPTPTPAPQPDYGEDPNSPGVFKVFNKSKVMDEVGIAQDDRQYVEKIIRSWVYKTPSGNVNLCDTQPAHKMKVIADDYETNPVTQLKWCNLYATERYGSWKTAAERYEANRIF